MINILDLYTQDAPGKIVSVSGGKEYRGPCPGCGGNDRFGVFPRQNEGEGSFFCGRAKGGGHGCGKGGDTIEYLRQFRNMSYAQACGFLGKETKVGGSSGEMYRRQLPPVPHSLTENSFIPVDKTYPAEVVDPEQWQKRGMEFVESCHQALLGRPLSIVYLQARGIDLVGIKKHKIGFHAGEIRDDKSYQPTFRPRKVWGLSEEKNDKGRPRMLILPAGLVIPYVADGDLHRITIRLIKPDPQTPKKKYHYVVGSIRDLWLSNPGAKAFVINEAELDCIAVECAAGDLVGTIGIGSSDVKPDLRAAAALDQSLCILGGLDNDKAGIDAGVWWEQNYRQYKRWPVPEGKDAGEYFQTGGDLRLWVMAGLPDLLLPTEEKVVVDVGPAPVQVDKIPGEDIPPSVNPGQSVPELEDLPPHLRQRYPIGQYPSELAELKDLLRQADGQIRIYDDGENVSRELPRQWRQDNPAKAGRISWLINSSESVGAWISEMADGLYSTANIRG